MTAKMPFQSLFPPFEGGDVALVGAGPGDPGLLTLKAAYFIQHAEVVLYDALVDDTILQLAAPGAVLEYVGKKAGMPSCSQELICRRLVVLAKSGKRVVRLKGGDPFVFGRGGEELLALLQNGVVVHTVAGVTAGIGGIASAGIPLTHRGVNSGAIFVTGSDKRGALTDLNWPALAGSGLPLVVYMGFGHRQQIARNLIAASVAPALPAAVVIAASTPRQRVVETTLGEIANGDEIQLNGEPAILVIGEIVGLRQQFVQTLPQYARADSNWPDVREA